jgi:hypothetical protein
MSRRPDPSAASLSAKTSAVRGGPGLLFSLRVPCALSPSGEHEVRLGRDGDQITYLAADCGAVEGDAAMRLGAKSCGTVLPYFKRCAFEGNTWSHRDPTLDSLLTRAAEDALALGVKKRKERASRRVMEGEGDNRYGGAAPDHTHAEFVARMREARMEVDYKSFAATDWKSAMLAKVARQITGFSDVKADYGKGAITSYYGEKAIVRRVRDVNGDVRWTLGDSFDARSYGRDGKRCSVCDRTFLAVGGHLNSEPHRVAVGARLMKLVNWLNKARKRSGVLDREEPRQARPPSAYKHNAFEVVERSAAP